MHATAAFLLAAAGLAAAQSSTATAASTSAAASASSSSVATSGCGEQIDLTISLCLSSTQGQLQACDDTDWDCRCTQQTNVLTCYNNCPSDPNAFGAEQTKTSYCNAAAAYGTSSSATGTASATASVSSALSSAIASQSASESAATASAASATDSSTSTSASASAASSTESSSAVNVAAPATGFLAAMFGLAALF